MLRIGHGYDVHRLVPGRPLILGGVSIPHEKGLLGHSDADVLIHAVCDACLGALALGDLGHHFSDTDDQWRNADSRDLLRRVSTMLEDRGYGVGNLDSTIICQQPKLATYITSMRENLAIDLGTQPENVSVKATTTEGLGFCGKGEGISAHAVVLLLPR